MNRESVNAALASIDQKLLYYTDMNGQRKRVTDGKSPLPVGDSDWMRIAQRTYCVDKTLMIKYLIGTETSVALIPLLEGVSGVIIEVKAPDADTDGKRIGVKDSLVYS